MSVFLNCLRFFSRTAAPLPEPEDLSESELRQALQAAGVEPLGGGGGGGGGGGEEQDQGGGGHRPLLEAQYRALVARKMAAANPGSRTLRREQCALGPFDCRVLNNFGAEGLVKHKDARLPVGLVPDVVVVALHGFGAAADQFESVFEGLLAANAGLAKRRLLIVCPQAKQLNGSPAWFPLDIMAWMMLFAQGEGGIARLIREEPPGMAEGRREILRCCEAVLGFCGFTDYSRVILTGFSQGAMMANDVGLHLPTPPLAIVSLSGIPLIVDRWTEKARQKAFQGLKVFVAHGRADQLLPFQASVWLHGLHSNNGLDATHHPHSGGHDIGGPADIAALAEYLHKTVGDHAPGKTAVPGKAVKVTAPAAAAAAGGGGGGAAAATEAVPAPAPVAAAAVDSDIFAAAAAAAAVAEDGGDGGDSASGE